MRDYRFFLKPRYANSRALIIGINKYQHVSPLEYAVNDAEEVRDTLINELHFPEENVVCLLDEQATKQNILRAFLRFVRDQEVTFDDRIFVFFAGHGHTETGNRGEVGYLVPYDAHIDDLSSLIRWNELTGNAELIRAKHMLFIMDACYGGLALTRALHPGSVRFLKDMTQRFSRQVITAGKADEVVADAGGPLPNHSVFTGHLLQGMRGAAANQDGILTASTLMAYVYSKVANDRNSNQTPHYGYFDGDGDFILQAPRLFATTDLEEIDSDETFIVPFIEEEPTREALESKISKIKRLLSDDSAVIEMHDMLVQEVQHFLSQSSLEQFSMNEVYSDEGMLDRLSKYESVTADLRALEACIAYWSKPAHQLILQKALARSTDQFEQNSGLNVWLELRWYPLILQLYSTGIAAVAAQRYDTLAKILTTKIVLATNSSQYRYLIDAVSDAIAEFYSFKLFSKLPGRERNHVPMSEHLFKLLQPALDDILFIGKDYESSFDEFEVFLALVEADNRKQDSKYVWGPIGRFGYKSRNVNGPLGKVIAAARSDGSNWPPFKSGLFGGDIARFNSLADEFANLIARSGSYY